MAPAVLIALWQGAEPRAAAWAGFAFNLGTFVAGTYWVFIGLTRGDAPIWMALAVWAGLVAVMAVYGGLLGYAVARWLPASGAFRWMAGIPAAWLFVEWWRGWFLTGFAWLSLGYSQADTWLGQACAPILGMYGLSALLLVGAGALVTLLWGRPRERWVALLVLILPWLAAVPLKSHDWTHPVGKPVGVAIIQGSIPEDQKWQDEYRDRTLQRYRRLTLSALGTPVIIWPEAAPPDLANNLTAYLLGIYRQAHDRGSSLLIGVLRSDGGGIYYNSVLALGSKVGWYDKRHLVPFAEFFPVPRFVRNWLRIKGLPYSDFTRGPPHQPPLSAAGLHFATSICYEDVYGSYELPILAESDALVNVTNDAWFAHTTEHAQHLEIARMRALEDGRYLLRAANDGISAVIGPHGRIVASAPQYRPYVLEAKFTARRGLTPYANYGNWLIICLAAATLVLVVGWSRLRAKVPGPEPEPGVASDPTAVAEAPPSPERRAHPRSLT
ncbi:MAG: apolipoprotein N-acyltransferase [Steroidobacteraceae bacterium]